MTVRFRYLGLSLALLVAAATHTTLARAAGVDFWNIGDERAELERMAVHNRALEDQDEVIMRRIVIKEELVTTLVAGRATLAEVAAQFLALNATEPSYLDHIRATVPGDSDLERAARNVIYYASTRVDPAHRAAVLHRLDAELVRMQDADHPAAR